MSQLLPPKTYFDVVVFDEASQITPADAISSILRGTQLVIAGDERQLPPTAFFVSESPEDEDEEPEATPVPIVAGTKGFESILDALGSLLRFRMLRWHYRSRDERLIAFSNAHIYDRQLTTFPGVGGTDVLRYVQADWQPGADTNSPSPEVDAAVDLVLDHARTRPQESLGVIAMGIKHANRIEECLRQRLRDDPELEDELGEFSSATALLTIHPKAPATAIASARSSLNGLAGGSVASGRASGSTTRTDASKKYSPPTS